MSDDAPGFGPEGPMIPQGGHQPCAAENAALRAFGCGHDLMEPSVWRSGVIFASPHSGHLYPAAFRERSGLSVAALRQNEDMFIDRFFACAPQFGAPLLTARFPRCYVDVNRAPTEMPQDWCSVPIKETPRARAGLGVVPTHMSERTPIYRKPPSLADARARMDRLYHPYHAALRGLITQSKDRFGQALLIDCHSMPGFAPLGARRPDMILGDRFGRSCHPETLTALRSLLQDQGYSVAINYPYAGGFVTEHYGRPDLSVEAIQIEINRDLYLNPVTLAPKRGFEELSQRLSDVVAQIIDWRLPKSLAAQ